MKRIILAAAALLLSACASTGTRDGLVYRDGSWYSPATAGRGDYYTGASHAYDHYYDVPWAWSVGFIPYGGYCPVMYRYCTSFWAGAWYAPLGYPYAGYPYAGPPHAYQPWALRPDRPGRHRRHASETLADGEVRSLPDREPANRGGPRTREGGVGSGGRRAKGGMRPHRTGGEGGRRE